MSISITGARELRDALRQAGGSELVAAVARANKDAAEVVVRRAQPMIPTRSGRLRSSVRALGSQRVGRVRAGSASVPYAAAIHWGRRRGNVGSPPGNHPGRNVIRGRPFLTDAAQASLPQVYGEYRNSIDELLDRVIGNR